MSKVFGAIFGTPSKSQQSSASSSASGFAALPEFGQNAWEDLIANAGNLSSNPDLFTNAPITPEMTAALDVLKQPYGKMDATQFREGLDTYMNPYIDDVVGGVESDLRRMGAGLFSDLGSDATDAGAFGGTRQAVAQGEIGRNLLDVLGDKSSMLRSSGYETAANRVLDQFNTENAGEQAKALDLFGSGTILQELDTQNKNAPVSALSWLQQILSGLNSSTSTGTSQGTSVGGTPGIVGNLATAIGSDRRLKTNIIKIGEKNGINIYHFNYNDQPGTFEGVMADEVEEIYPDAVIEEDGFKKVFYDKIDIEFKEVA